MDGMQKHVESYRHFLIAMASFFQKYPVKVVTTRCAYCGKPIDSTILSLKI